MTDEETLLQEGSWLTLLLSYGYGLFAGAGWELELLFGHMVSWFCM